MGLRRVATSQEPNLVSLYEPTPIEIVQTQSEFPAPQFFHIIWYSLLFNPQYNSQMASCLFIYPASSLSR